MCFTIDDPLWLKILLCRWTKSLRISEPTKPARVKTKMFTAHTECKVYGFLSTTQCLLFSFFVSETSFLFDECKPHTNCQIKKCNDPERNLYWCRLQGFFFGHLWIKGACFTSAAFHHGHKGL